MSSTSGRSDIWANCSDIWHTKSCCILQNFKIRFLWTGLVDMVSSLMHGPWWWSTFYRSALCFTRLHTQTDLAPSFPRITPDLLLASQLTPPNHPVPFWAGLTFITHKKPKTISKKMYFSSFNAPSAWIKKCNDHSALTPRFGPNMKF